VVGFGVLDYVFDGLFGLTVVLLFFVNECDGR